MIPLLLFLLACIAVYLSTVSTAFSGLMRLSLRILAERSGRPGHLAEYLDDPVLLFAPVRLLLGVTTAMATAFMAMAIGVGTPDRLMLVIVSMAGFVLVFEILVPLTIVARDPERVLEVLLPTFHPITRALAPLSGLARRPGAPRRAPAAPDEAREPAVTPGGAAAPSDRHSEGEERRLLQSIVDFGETLVREVMTPRPDIVAIREAATIGELRALFREQEYSRFPVYRESLDNIAGFVFVKDLVALDADDDGRPIAPLIRPAAVVPESKRVPELLKQFQRQQTQIAIVVDEYGGTAGIVTIEDMLEELVGEIRDEYDVEPESVVDEGGGRFTFSGKANIDAVTEHLNVPIEREGFETVGGFLLAHLGRVPVVGERFDVDGLTVEVLDVERRRINKARMYRKAPAEVENGVREKTI
jgi:CBS domain containing-hemolysin-like protein